MFSPDPPQKIQKGNNRVAKVICTIFFWRAEIVQEQRSILLPKQSSGALKMFQRVLMVNGTKTKRVQRYINCNAKYCLQWWCFRRVLMVNGFVCTKHGQHVFTRCFLKPLQLEHQSLMEDLQSSLCSVLSLSCLLKHCLYQGGQDISSTQTLV